MLGKHMWAEMNAPPTSSWVRYCPLVALWPVSGVDVGCTCTTFNKTSLALSAVCPRQRLLTLADDQVHAEHVFHGCWGSSEPEIALAPVHV